MFCSPLDEFLVFGEHGINHLIEDVVSRLAEERGVRVQRLRGFSIESRNVPQDLFPAGPRFDERHSTLLPAVDKGIIDLDGGEQKRTALDFPVHNN